MNREETQSNEDEGSHSNVGIHFHSSHFWKVIEPHQSSYLGHGVVGLTYPFIFK